MTVGRPRAFDVEKALDRAMDVFWRKGYEGASLADLTKAMGINPPSLYAAFGNKEGLFRRALDRYADGRANFMSEVLSAPTARRVAERMLRGSADLLTDPRHPPGCLLVQGGLACGTGGERVPDELASRRAGSETELCARFEQAQRDGDLSADTDPAALARYLATVTQGMAVKAAAGASREELRDVAETALRALPEDASPRRRRRK